MAAGFFGDPVEAIEESPSQISQATDPVNASLEETVPEYLQRRDQARRLHALSPLIIVLLVLVPLMLAAAILVASVVLKALWS